MTTVRGAPADGDVALVAAARRPRARRRGLPADGRAPSRRCSLPARPPGLFRGTQTLRQLLPPAIETREAAARAVARPACVTIHDRPRFAWRGMMLDVARHFFGVAEIERLIDLLALYKLNRLHLHLTDDQGWRLAIRSRPRLTRLGSSTAVGGGPGGHFTQRDYRRIVAYARRAVRRGRAGDRHAGPRERRALRVRRAGVRRDRPSPVHGHRRRLQLALHPQGGDVRLRRRRGRRGRGAHARPVPPHRRRRAAVHRPGRLPLLRRARPADRARPRQADARLGGDRARSRSAARPLVQHWHDPQLARAAVARGRSSSSRPRRRRTST